MKQVADMTAHIVNQAKTYESDTVPGDFATLRAPCPKCGGVIRENYKKFQCQSCEYSLWKIVAGRQFEIEEIETLLTKREVGPLIGFRNKMGRVFNALVKLNDEQQPTFDFGQGKEDGSSEPVDFGDQTPLGACPKCQSRVFEHGLAFVCEKSVGPEKSCDFRSGKIILQQEIGREQMQKLLSDGRTDLLKGFVSARTKRKFSAFLVRDASGKVSFEFEVKTPSAKGAKKPAAAKAPTKATATKAATTKTAAATKAKKQA